MNKIPHKIRDLISQVRSFGALGECYEIVAVLHPLKEDDWLMKIKLLDSGELIPYCYSEILYDPIVKKTNIARTSL